MSTRDTLALLASLRELATTAEARAYIDGMAEAVRLSIWTRT